MIHRFVIVRIVLATIVSQCKKQKRSDRDVTFENCIRRHARVGKGKEARCSLANVITGVHFVANYSEIPARPVLSSVN